MGWDSRILDMVLVPLGLVLLAVYHVYLWFQVKYHPESTVIGNNHINRQAWVNSIMSVSEFLLFLHTLFLQVVFCFGV